MRRANLSWQRPGLVLEGGRARRAVRACVNAGTESGPARCRLSKAAYALMHHETNDLILSHRAHGTKACPTAGLQVAPLCRRARTSAPRGLEAFCSS